MIRSKEADDFKSEEKDLTDTISTLERAIAVLEKETKQGGAALVQRQAAKAGGLIEALKVMIDVHSLNTADSDKLTTLVEMNEGEEESDGSASDSDEQSAPASDAYKSKSGGLIETMENLLEKAQAQLEESRRAETKKRFNYEIFKQSLEDKIRISNQDMDEAKKELGEAGEKKATAEGDLEVTQKDLAEGKKALEELHHDCMSKAADFEEETKSRAEELKALAEAKKVISESTGGAKDQAYFNQVSFVQVSSTRHHGRTENKDKDGADLQAVNLVRKLAWAQGSESLVQLASSLESVLRSSDLAGEDPFAKVKTMIGDMLTKLQEEAESEAAHKEYCDKEMGETQAKKEDKEDSVERLTTKMDQMSAESAKLAEEAAIIQKELSQLMKTQNQMDKIRQKEKFDFGKAKPELEKGIKGVQTALKVLRDYYASDSDKEGGGGGKASGGGAGIIALLEVVESDFSKTLSELLADEDAAQSLYEELTQENTINKKMKEQDLKYKTKNAKSLDKAVSELSSDRDGAQTELDAVNEYFSKLKETCVAKAEPYEERKKRRDQEIAGLREALQVLGSDSLMQESSGKEIQRSLRGLAEP